jgi:hypothetical protein
MGERPASNAFLTFAFISISFSPKMSLLSECPMMMYLTPASLSMGAEISPVKAPLSSM